MAKVPIWRHPKLVERLDGLRDAAGEIPDIANAARSITGETGSMHLYPDSLTDLTPEGAGWFDFMEPTGQYDIAPEHSKSTVHAWPSAV